MARSTTSRNVQTRENFFGFLTDKKVTYHRDVAKERKERKAAAIEDRKERIAMKKLAAEERAAEAKLAQAERKIAAAEKTIKAAKKKTDQGGMAEQQFEAMKARMQREIEAQEKYKAAALAKMNPRNAGKFSKRKSGKLTGKSRKSIRKSGRKSGKANPAADAAALSEKFHGRKANTERRIVEPMHEHKHLMEIGVLVRLVIDTPTGLVAVLNFNTRDPKKIVYLSCSERDPKTGKLIGKQIYLRGGDQEINLAGLGLDSPRWIRDHMELGRLHGFKRGERLIMDASGKLRIADPGERAKAGEEEIKGSITYQTRKGFDHFELINYFHQMGEKDRRAGVPKPLWSTTDGPEARPIVTYDYRNKKIGFVGGQYYVDRPGIIN